MLKILLTVGVAALFLAGPTCAAAEDLIGPASTIERARALDQLDRRLAHFVDWRRIPDLRSKLRDRRDDYLAATSTEAFLEAVNVDLYKASGDRHLQIWVEPHSRDEVVPQPNQAGANVATDFGIRNAWRDGSVAILELTEISGEAAGADALDEVMDTLRGADVLILDLRNNGGGGEAVQRRLLGHLAPRPLPLEEIHFRHCEPDPNDREGCLQDGRTDVQMRSADAVPQPAFPTQPIFVLVSHRTFSAAEAIAYNLQASRQAVVVGETTGGGANPSAAMDLGPWFTVVMPIATTVLQSTRTNWEGTGVIPDIASDEAHALEAALRAASATLR
jgi:C-terminal processing protease CtpA/Prc